MNAKAKDPSDTNRPLWMRLLKRSVPVLIILAAIGGVVALAALPKPEEQMPETTAPPVNVTAITLEPIREYPDDFTISGKTEPWAVATISAEVAGRVQRIDVNEGDLVRLSQPLVYLETDLIEAQVAQTRAQLQFNRQELRRAEQAIERGVATEMELDAARATLEDSRARYEYQLALLRRATITAPDHPLGQIGLGAEAGAVGTDNEQPVIGRVESMDVEIGDYLTPDKLVATLVDISRMKVVVNLPEADVQYLLTPNPDHPPVVELTALDREVTGRITFIAATADPRTLTYRTEIEIPNPDGDIRAGMIVRVRLVRRVLEEAFFVPLEALVRTETAYEVFVIEDGQARRRAVEIGVIRGQQAEVLPLPPGHAGRDEDYQFLAAGDQLIVQDPRMVSEGQAVNVEPTVEEKLAAAVEAAGDDAPPAVEAEVE